MLHVYVYFRNFEIVMSSASMTFDVCRGFQATSVQRFWLSFIHKSFQPRKKLVTKNASYLHQLQPEYFL